MTYVGIAGSVTGVKVPQSEAFRFALLKCTTCHLGDDNDCRDFVNIFLVEHPEYKTNSVITEEFERDLVEWFYSGNWIKEE